MADANKTVAPIPTETAPPVSIPAPAASPPAPAPPPKQIVQNSYQVLFPTLANLAHQGNYLQLISAAEFGDLKADDDRHVTRLLLIAPLVLAYLTENNLPPAKCVLDRLPEKLASHPLAQTLFGLLASAWEKNYDHIYSRVDTLFHQAQQPDFVDPKLGEIVALMVKGFEATFQKRTIALLSQTYASLPVDVAQQYLGLPPDQLIPLAHDLGWSYDASAQILKPSAGSPSVLPASAQGPSSLHKFNVMADSTARLELQ